jgi:hypothetical protein
VPPPQPRGNVHAVAVEIVTIDDKIAEMQTDSEYDPAVFGLIPIGLRHSLLEFDGRAQRFHGARKLGQRAIPGELD